MITSKKKTEAVRIPLEKEMLEDYLESLVQKLNARLMKDQKAGTGSNTAQMLWVESITLTAYDIENDEQKGR